MLVEVTLTIFLYIFLHILRIRIAQSSFMKNRNPLAMFMSTWGGQDKVLKLVQNGLFFVAGFMSQGERYVVDHARQIVISKTQNLDNIANFLVYCRKVTRFPRTRLKLKQNRRLFNKIFQGQCKSRQIQEIFRFLGQVFDTIYFLCDHYMTIYLMSIFINLELSQNLQFCFSFIWMLSDFCFIIRDFFLGMRYFNMKNRYEQKKKHENGQQQYTEDNLDKFLKFLIIDLFRNILNILTNWAAIYSGTFAKNTVGLLGATESILWMLGTLVVPQII